MKTPTFLSLLTLSALCLPFTPTARAQGSLAPPAGPPVASMRTLDQVEARTPLVAGAPGVAISAAGTITISQPGSYYLTRNVTITTNVNGIEINADATVDLNGFGIIGTLTFTTTGDAIVIAPTANATIRNGFIRGGTVMPTDKTYTLSGFRHGIFADMPAVGVRPNATVTDVTVSRVRQHGIFLRRLSVVDRCVVQAVGGNGIDVAPWVRPDTASFDNRLASLVRDSQAGDCGGQYGIGAQRVISCFGHTTSSGSDYGSARCGILALIVENSTGSVTGSDLSAFFENFGVYGIHARSASLCIGAGETNAINASIAIGCHSQGGTISGNKFLGTP